MSSIGNQSPVEKELVHRLALFLKANMPSLNEALEEWPDTNVQLKMPSLSIMTKKVTFTPFQPEVYAHPDTPNEPIDQPRQTCDMLVGEYDQPLQLDLWTANKEDRSKLMDEFFKAFAPVSPDRPNGISLQLPNYYGAWSRFDLDTYEYVDDEASVQRSERRATISVLSNCPAIRTQILPVLKTIVVQPKIVDNITDNS